MNTTPEHQAAIAELIGPPTPDLLDVQRQVWELHNRLEDLAAMVTTACHCPCHKEHP